jgi:hypothetical protein
MRQFTTPEPNKSHGSLADKTLPGIVGEAGDMTFPARAAQQLNSDSC